MRYASGNTWVVAFNMRPRDRNGFRGELERALAASAQRVARNWPPGDLWPEFGGR